MKYCEIYTFYMHRIDQNYKPIAKYVATGTTKFGARRTAKAQFFKDFSVPWYKRWLYHTTEFETGEVDEKNFK